MRHGFTTGSCAAAAAKAAAIVAFSGQRKERITIATPKGIEFIAEPIDYRAFPDGASCGVRKDGGDDPDATTGAVVYAKVTLDRSTRGQVRIDGGEGVGRVTLPGLDQPVGNAAINTIPRQRIEAELRETARAFDYQGSFDVVISVPGGEKIAQRTFNPRLGIVGGVSILGTSGVVEPMSMQAIADTIRVEARQKRALGRKTLVAAPGNYGLDFIAERFGFNLEDAVKCSNFIGQTIDIAVELGFNDMLLCGHIGKLIKTAGGIMNTHSREADARMELAAAIALEIGADRETAMQILRSISTDEAVKLLHERSLDAAFMTKAAERIGYYAAKRAGGKICVESLVFSHQSQAVGTTPRALELLERATREARSPSFDATDG